jgi:hypothetical protein
MLYRACHCVFGSRFVFRRMTDANIHGYAVRITKNAGCVLASLSLHAPRTQLAAEMHQKACLPLNDLICSKSVAD